MKLKNYFIFLVFIIVLCISYSVSARTIYVDQNGSGDYITIQSAINAAQPGDTVIVRKGIYHETVNIEKTGTKENPITLRAQSNGEGDVIITAADKNVRNGQIEWKKADGTEDVYYIEHDREVGSMLADGAFMMYAKSYEQLCTRAYNGQYLGFPQLGYWWDEPTGKLYVRLHEKYVKDKNPNNLLMCVGGSCYSSVKTDMGDMPATGSQAVVKNTNCYNIGVWTEGESYINIEGFTFETPGYCAIYLRGSNVNIRDCYFRGCRVGVKAGNMYLEDKFYSNYVTVDHCDFTQWPIMTTCWDMIKDMTPEKLEKEASAYYWPSKSAHATKHSYEEIGLVSGAAYHWEISNNYCYDIFEPFSQVFTTIYWEPYEGRRYSIDGGYHKIHHNKIENCVDNVIEFENHTHDIEFYNNECINSMNPISWQPLAGYPFPKNSFIHHNIFYCTDEFTKDYDKRLNGGKTADISDPFKIGANAKNYSNNAWMQDAGHYLNPGSTVVPNRPWYVDDKGLVIYNNTIVSPEQYTMTYLGSIDQIGEYGASNMHYINNIFYSHMQTEDMPFRKQIKPGTFFSDTHTMGFDSNIFIPSNPDSGEFKTDSLCIERGYAYKTFEEAGLTLCERNGIKTIEITSPDSVAVNKGTQVSFEEEKLTYIGAIPYGKEWKMHCGVYPRGDTNFDRKVDEKDILSVRENLSATVNDENFVSRHDLNFDGCVDKTDLELIISIVAGGDAL